jgi:hypothetical protein
VKKLAPLTGVVFFVLLLISVLIGGNSLTAKSSGAQVLAHYVAHRNATNISGELTLLAVFVGLIFYGQLRDFLRSHERSRGLTATAFAGAVLFAASGAVGAGAMWALADSPSHLSPAAAQTLYLINMDVSYPLSLAGIALLFFCFGLVIVKSALLPTWLGWVAFPLTLIAFVPPIGFASFIGVGVWTLIVSLAMWRRLASTDTAAATAMVASSPT